MRKGKIGIKYSNLKNMALTAKFKEGEFGVGDTVKVTQRTKEGEKERAQTFEGVVIAIRGSQENKSFTIRRIGVQQIGIERIFPLASPSLEWIQVVRKGTSGVKRAKLYYIRGKAKREIEKIYSRVSRKGIHEIPKAKKKRTSKKGYKKR